MKHRYYEVKGQKTTNKIIIEESGTKYLYKGSKVIYLDTTQTTAFKSFCYVKLENGKKGIVDYNKLVRVENE